MKNKILLFCTILLLFNNCKKCAVQNFDCNFSIKPIHSDSIITSISFGSCSSEASNQPILNDVVAKKPNLFIYLGDNVYVDSKDCSNFYTTYSKLACKNEFQNLVTNIPTIAVWDDHDYGQNDAGKEYSLKEKSKEIFLNFWKEPTNSQRYLHKGIYHSLYFGDTAHKVQIILLDMRTFRSYLKVDSRGYAPDFDANKTFLGNEQWNWLEKELLKPAKIRIIASSTQFGIEHNFWEAWANFPLEQQKMANLIKSTHANGVIFISGDVHYSELSKQTFNNCYPVYDCTASGLTQIYEPAAQNIYRIGNAITKANYGNLKINWHTNPIEITYTIFSINNNIEFNYTILLNEISF